MADLRASGLGGVPKGQTASRPSSPSIGDVFYNGTSGILEIYTSSGWQPCSAPSGTPTIVVSDLGANRTFAQGPAFQVDFTPSTLGGFPTGYSVSATTGATSQVYTAQVNAPTTTIILPVLAGAAGAGATYSVNGASFNGFGSSPYTVGGITVTTKPEAPTIGSATISNITSAAVVVSWTNGSNGGKTISSYTITPYIGSTAQTPTVINSSSITSASITGLTNGSTYTFKVKTTNANGESPESSATNSIKYISGECLVVAGGGGGASIIGGGGGAGGARSFNSITLGSGIAYALTIGSGGRGGTGYSSNVNNESGYPGWDSVFANVTASGGGGAIGWSGQGPTPTYSGQRTWSASGGSGGGASANSPSTYGVKGSGNIGGYTPVEGYAGGDSDGDTAGLGGGGGGAGGVGITVSKTGNTNGGIGISSSITGTATYYAGGGGAGRRITPNNGGSISGNSTGGSGGGGTNGTSSSFSSSQNGTSGLGGGGACGNYPGPDNSSQAGGNGGSGVVIIKIPNTSSATFSAGVSSSLSTSVSGYKVYTVTAAGTSDTVTFS